MPRLFIRVSGRVQGIGFRYFVRRLAQEYNFTGWVRNCPDGSVEMEVQFPGDRSAGEVFLNRLKKEHPDALIASVEKKEIPEVSGEKGFGIKTTYGVW